jgi:hypothetical protein
MPIPLEARVENSFAPRFGPIICVVQLLVEMPFVQIRQEPQQKAA